MKVVNLTPHDVNIVNEAGEIIASFPKSGIVARVATTKQVVGEIDGIPIKAVKYGAIENLPEPDGESMFIVSMVVASAASARDDLICPDTAPDATVRDKNGQITGVRNFARY